ncbi:hypothetical protein K9O30_12025 [Clostridium bowmanii]|uniref:hypothetical protein n=1 Tax=Clostridium bowmanii TaxID=132925 RepID=UPI001C0AF533|nr:hypothetical protein [Clostridium bowmanii]MBU3190503.1 hypothetical protein [Clostridium bowmanii]MCA1074435.1 hypothetical protein [Clostridium bowmanii]
MKIKSIILSLAVGATLLVGCGAKEEAKTTTAPAKTEVVATDAAKTDVVTTASLVNTEAAFESALSSKGTWIIATIKDLTFDKEIIVEGEFKNGKKDDAGKEVIQRKIALYTQDADRNVTARFTLTAPKLTFNSPMGSIEHGTFKGDLYVSASNFQLKDATVEGNVYFTTDEAKSTFKMDAKSKITGVQELKK